MKDVMKQDSNKSKARKLLAIPDGFRSTAMSFPDKVDQALALLSSVDDAKELLDQADLLAHYARRIKADTEVSNYIQYGKLKIIAKLGSLMPALPPQEYGEMKGKGSVAGTAPFSSHTKSAYRKVAKNDDKLREYFESITNTDTPQDLTISGFLSHCNQESRSAKPEKHKVLWDYINMLSAYVQRMASEWPRDARPVLTSQLRRLADESEAGTLFQGTIHDDCRGQGIDSPGTATA